MFSSFIRASLTSHHAAWWANRQIILEPLFFNDRNFLFAVTSKNLILFDYECTTEFIKLINITITSLISYNNSLYIIIIGIIIIIIEGERFEV